MKEAKARRDLVGGELAAGRNPADLLRAFAAEPVRTIALTEWADRFLTSRIDFAKNTADSYRSSLKKACETLGDRDPHKLGWADITAWIAGLVDADYKPATIGLYKTHLAVLLDYVGVDPNPAKDQRVKLPRREHEVRMPPSADHFEAIVAAATSRFRLALVTVEQTAVREGELVRMAWGHMDRKNLKVLIPAASSDEEGALGAATRVAVRCDRGDLPARRPHTRAARVPGDHRGSALPGDEARLRVGRRSTLHGA
jgi:hypothetical protein